MKPTKQQENSYRLYAPPPTFRSAKEEFRSCSSIKPRRNISFFTDAVDSKIVIAPHRERGQTCHAHAQRLKILTN